MTRSPLRSWFSSRGWAIWGAGRAITSRLLLQKVQTIYRVAPPSPTSTNGAQNAGCASYFLPVSIIDIIDRRNASARPIWGSAFNSATTFVISLTVASDATSQCDTNSERAPA
jgi:hypothetical protein